MKKRTVLIWDQDVHAVGLYARKFEQEKWTVKTVDTYQKALVGLKGEPEAFLFDLQTLEDQQVNANDFVVKTQGVISLLAILVDVKKTAYPDKVVEEYNADTYLLKGHFVPSESVAKIARLVDEARD